MEEGKAGQFRVRTVRPPAPSTKFTASLLESEAEVEGDYDGSGGPVAFLGTDKGTVVRVGYGSSEQEGDGGGGPAFQILWQSSIPSHESPIFAFAREGDMLACGAADGRVFLLHAGTGGAADAGAGPAMTIDTGLGPVTSLLWL